MEIGSKVWICRNISDFTKKSVFLWLEILRRWEKIRDNINNYYFCLEI